MAFSEQEITEQFLGPNAQGTGTGQAVLRMWRELLRTRAAMAVCMKARELLVDVSKALEDGQISPPHASTVQNSRDALQETLTLAGQAGAWASGDERAQGTIFPGIPSGVRAETVLEEIHSALERFGRKGVDAS